MLWSVGLLLGMGIGYILFFKTPSNVIPLLPSNQKMGFLPYWLLDAAQKDYSEYLNGIYYFGLTIDDDGSLKEYENPGEKEPGWYALESGKATPFLTNAKKKNQKLSLVVFNANEESIAHLLENPTKHAKTLVSEAAPIMKEHGFTDLNIDIESFEVASDSARESFTTFIQETKKEVQKRKLGTLSIDVSPSAFIKKFLVDPKSVIQYVDSLVIMGYDYHYQGSMVTGPVAPLFGAGEVSEFDVQVAVGNALSFAPSKKIILGAPLYGYEWETLSKNPSSPVIVGTGLVASNKRVEELLSSCATCSSKLDATALEKYVVYKALDTNTYHQLFYPDKETMEEKVRFAQKNNLGGIALWALGYESPGVLDPLQNY